LLISSQAGNILEGENNEIYGAISCHNIASQINKMQTNSKKCRNILCLDR
jgi:hypothetical protein